ncbi:hypothetical protein PVAND_001769 [Polypedilum vanderplanki]|uniref:PHD finger protein 14 n=1 Tax=Polypedilum vanderplanki TaxID=319348 RepID=A0A9J6BPD5_POLVA|nr:hypothetical protein PVAND_001769 [Polypedilum vanderplanki]
MKEKRTSASLFGLFMSDFLDDDEEESSDEDFRVEDHVEHSEDDDESDEDNEDSSEDGSSENESELSNEPKKKNVAGRNSNSPIKITNTTDKLAEQTKNSLSVTEKLLNTPICCACLGDRSDDTNEIVECDSCKITVHEGCYGISDSISVSSTVSSCSTEPWFCEPCKANVKDPDCELCPNKGGIFKETDVGKWVHLVCALYVPGVAFGEVDQLSSVTLFEMPYNKWGAKKCSLCDNDHFARTGVCIGCDAGMCKSYFHVTCAQREGLLSEAHHEEADQADPFYAHCKVHSDKTLIKHRKKNYNALLMQMKRHEVEAEQNKNEKPTEAQERIERKLKKHRIKYATNKINRPEPWVPQQKMPRSLLTSASAVNKLAKKAEIMEINTEALEFEEAQIASLTDIRKKWHIPVAFTTEFVGYYLDRQIRMKEMKSNLEQQVEVNKTLLSQQSILRTKYDDAIKINHDTQQRQRELVAEIEMLHNSILAVSPTKQLPSIENIGKPMTQAGIRINAMSTSSPTLSSTPSQQMITSRIMSVPTAAALKQGVGFPLNHNCKDDTGRILSTQCTNNDELLNECGICKKCNDQHLLAKCDTCHLYYHLGCLNPPLTRHPKRSKLYAWQCSECDKSDDSAPENNIIPKGQRRSRTIRYSKDGIIHSDASAFLSDSFGSDQSLTISKKSEEKYQQSNVSNGNDINLTDHELEAHVKETLQPDIGCSSSIKTISPVNAVSSTSVSSQENPLKKKRERKTKTVNGQKTKSKVSTTTISNANNENHINEEDEINSENLSSIQLQSEELITENQNAIESTEQIQSLPSSPSLQCNDNNIDNQQSVQTFPDDKKPKRGRPPKKTISQISNDLQKQIMPVTIETNETPLLDLSKKIECPLDQYRAFADIPNSCIPYPVSTELPKISDELETIPTTLLDNNSANELNGEQLKLTNGDVSLEYQNSTSGSSIHHKHKKRKSHKRHHSNSPSPNGDRQSSSKKHKRKHKHKDHDAPENPSPADMNRPIDEQGIEQPRIKIKFRAILQAGDDKKPPKFLWHVPHEGNDMNNGSSTANNSSLINELNQTQTIPIGNGHHLELTSPSPKKKRKSQGENSAKRTRLLLNISPNKNQELQTQMIASASTTPTNIESQSINVLNKSLPLPSQICDVCNEIGVSQNMVKCDDCQKNYHFHCLMPPLKKTPKKRGYSWHCADCDPTDRENN